MCSTACLACAEPVVHNTATTTVPGRDPTCAFDVVGSRPGPGYVEVAQIDRSFGVGQYRNPQEFAYAVRPKVCAVGGDVLVTELNGSGVVVRGIVFHRTSEPAGSRDRPGSPAPAATVCEPICSPGFSCRAGTCIPQCNPACTDAETCGNDRLCHPN